MASTFGRHPQFYGKATHTHPARDEDKQVEGISHRCRTS
jgi:hypothetical protein